MPDFITIHQLPPYCERWPTHLPDIPLLEGRAALQCVDSFPSIASYLSTLFLPYLFLAGNSPEPVKSSVNADRNCYVKGRAYIREFGEVRRQRDRSFCETKYPLSFLSVPV